MPKYLLLKHYRGGPSRTAPCARWTSGRPRTWRRRSLYNGTSEVLLEENGRVRRCAGAHAGAHLGALRRPGRGPAFQ